MESKSIFKNNDLKLELQENNREIMLQWSGESREREPGAFLTPIFDDVLSLNMQKRKKIVMDFRQLEFMNSSTVTPIIRLIEKVRNGENEILILYQRNADWQELCFSALNVFITKDRRIDIQGI